MTDLPSLINHFSQAKIAVFGDLMLDEFTYGTVNRISPEAPVPIIEVEFNEYRLGGCGNVASNLAALGSQVELFSVVGQDKRSEILSGLLKEQHITNSSLTDKTRPTPTKNRLIAHKQQVARLDWEKKHPIQKELEENILSEVLKRISKFDVLILSDYSKGFLTEALCQSLIEQANQAGRQVIVDPKAPFFKYRGAGLITPNFDEFKKYGKIETDKIPRNMHAHANQIINGCQIPRLLVTMGEDGMALLEKSMYSKVDAIKNGHEVIDITGAGDTAIAVCALALASGASYQEAMRLANYAAAVVVGKLGTAICTARELKRMMEHNDVFEEVRL